MMQIEIRLTGASSPFFKCETEGPCVHTSESVQIAFVEADPDLLAVTVASQPTCIMQDAMGDLYLLEEVPLHDICNWRQIWPEPAIKDEWPLVAGCDVRG